MAVKELLTPGEVAERLKVKQGTVLEWLRAGKLSGFKLGGLWRVDERDLRLFLESRRPVDDWRPRLVRLLAEFEAVAPSHLTEEELETEIQAARAEARAELRDADAARRG